MTARDHGAHGGRIARRTTRRRRGRPRREGEL